MLDHDALTRTGSAPTEVRTTSRQTKFSLAANYDPDLVPALAAYPVDEVYGRFPTDGISSGRPRYLATPLSGADLRSYIRLLDLARLQGWLSPLPECPIRLEARKIPENFLDGFRDRDCASMDCQTCGYCERIAAQAVSIAPEYRAEVLGKYAEMDDTMTTGRLWGV